MKNSFRGTATALVTPFGEEGICTEVLSELVEFQRKGCADAIVVLGTTGEPASLTDEERDLVVSCAVEAAAGKIKVFVGTGSNNLSRAVFQSKRAKQLGADGILVVTPYYNRCTQQGLYEYYKTIAENADLPMIAYNVPGRTGVNLSPETAKKLCGIANFSGIKDASGNMQQTLETLRLTRGMCELYSGEDALNLPILASGGAGVVSVVSNLAPEKVSSLTNAALAGNFPLARTIFDELFPLVKACFSEINPIPVKEGLRMLGFGVGIPRPPLTPLSEARRDALREAMLSCGLEVIR